MESPSPSDSLLLEDFGQKVDLTRRIREVLLNYPEGTTVLKELIQNADDAGATRVSLCLDRRSHHTDSLLSPTLAQWQGPALLAFNDAVFTDEDFVSISRIGGSTKHGQAWKTGRFGVGFNSVYHLTDLPSFVSDKYAVIFDPQGIYLPNVSAANPGKRIEYTSSSAISLFKDQFLPYCAFGCDMQSPFNGTLFRFPLRNADQAANSRLSRQAYFEDDVQTMFDQLYDEGISSLLFLKSVQVIDMYVWDSGNSIPRKLYSCSINSADGDTISHRQLLLRLSKSERPYNGVTDCFRLDFVSEDFKGETVRKQIDSFYIVQSMASGSSRIASFAKTASKEYDIHLLPWASVAACISNSSAIDDGPKLGRAFCFLPLPVRTGLAVQVNGYFEVSSNRRGIWYGEDMDRSGKVRSSWNRLLLEDVVAPSFTQLLLRVQEILGPTRSYYSLWPSGDFEEPWNLLAECIYRNVAQVPVLYTYAGGGKWVSPTGAFLHDNEFSKSEELCDVLVQLGLPIARVPHSLHHMLLKHATNFEQKLVTSDAVRHFLRECGSLSVIGSSEKLLLLEYCLEDLLDSEVGKDAYNLQLLPLANGDFGLISEFSKGSNYFLCNDTECKLLEQIFHRVIDPNIPKNILSRLSAIAESSGANIAVFNVELLAQLLHKFVPSNWRFKSKVLWDPNTHPTSSWFRLFWEYLLCHCENLSQFDDWPIIPSTSGHLHRASKKSKLVDAENLSEMMKLILEKIGCKILDKRYKVEHHELSQYVSSATAAVVLKSIFEVVSSSGGIIQTCIPDLDADERNELRCFLLDSSWYIGGSMIDSDIKRSKKLPIFRVYEEGSTNTFQFTDLDETLKYLPPANVPSFFLGSEFICSTSLMEEEILSKYYDVNHMKKAHFFRREVFPRIGDIQPEDRDSIMISVLLELPQLCIEDSFFKEVLRNIPFVPTFTGAVKCPIALYDPRSEELHALLEDADVFPSGPFKEPEILDVLQGLGLRTSVSPETIIQSARTVEQLLPKDPQKAYLKGKVLLSYLEASAHRWASVSPADDPGALNRILSRAAIAFRPRNCISDLDKFWSDLCIVSWCPVLLSAPHEALPWPTVSSTVAPPKLVRLKTDMWLVSASMRILDGECYSSVLSYHLGWSSALSGSVVAAQILELGKNNEIVVDQSFRKELALAMPKIYARLTELIGSDEMEIVKAVLEGCRWVWVGDGFATAEEVVLSGTLHLAPYIRVVPVDLAVFRELFLELGVQEFLSFADYSNILCRMASRKEGISLTPQELTAAFMIVQHLAESQSNEKQVKIYLPDASGQLLLASELVYNDAPWLLGMDDSGNPSNQASPGLSAKQNVQRFVHGNISNDVAERLGVSSLRRLMLAESADSMNLGLSGAVEAFGQHEALTTRLKHILEMYADGPGILFELVQNAEDAGASEVIFLLDTTQYGTSSVLSPEMADWQGPALYCYNDSVFSPHDLYAISRIGQESKLEKPLAIGRFGLGFNCVYHFTDIPGFVSGENVVMFDPHACNLPGISASHPGLRIKFVGRRILEQFPDQFSPFLHFGCDLQHSFPGTLFRFPLRSATVAQRSQIKTEGYSPEDVLSLFSTFSKAVSETLLFLQKVKSISIYVKDGSTSDMQLLHRVERNRLVEPESEAYAKHPMFQYMHSGQANMDMSHLFEKLNRSIKTELRWTCQKVIMMEQHPSSQMSHLWLMSECFGTGEVDNSKIPKTRSKSSIPWAAVAAQLRSVEIEEEQGENPFQGSFSISSDVYQVEGLYSQHQSSFEGHAFCFLPLPINTGLPAHVNAYFELSSNRRDIWFGNDMSGGGKKRSDWNVHLLENVAAPAYGRLLEKMALELGPCDLYFSLWPTKIGVEPWSSMVRKVYMYIADACVPVLYAKSRGGRWISTKQALLPDFSFTKMVQLIEALSVAGLPVVTVSQPVVERFMDVCPSLYYLTPQLLRSLLIRRKFDFHERSALILTLEYCLFDVKKPVNPEHLHGLPLIPLANGSSTILNPRGVSETFYITHAEEYGLLKDSLPSQLVDNTIPEEVYDKLCDIAQSENSNLSFLTCDLLEKIFLRILPVNWQNAKQVTWSPGFENHPSIEWMKLLWNYLKINCDDLSVFAKWPILPVGDQYLMQLVKNSNIIEDGGWSENISSLLEKVGCSFLRRELSIEHPQLRTYVQPPTAAGIMNALLAISGKDGNIEELFADASEVELHELRSFVLQSKWFSDDGMNAIHIDVIKHIPMFESSRSRKLYSLIGSMRWLRPNGLRDDLVDDNFVRSESEKERLILMRYLNVQELSKGEFYKDFVLNRMSEFLSSQETVLGILHDVKLLMEEDVSMKAALSVTPFVLTCSGSWQQPCRLYDPRVSELRLLLHKEVFFPSEKFSAPEILDMLVGLGLKQSLAYTDLLDCARSVSIFHDYGDSAALVKGRRLFECLDSLGSKLSPKQEEASDIIRKAMSCVDGNFTESEEQNPLNSAEKGDWDLDSFLNILIDDKPEDDFWSELKSISWCPVCADPIIKGFPWIRSHGQVATPSNVRLKSQMWMVSSSMYILDSESYSNYIQHKLGWLDAPKANVLVTQLIELTKWYSHHKFDSAAEIIDVELQNGFNSLYSAMQEYVNTGDIMIMKSELQGVPWIWIGDGFVSSDALAFDSPVKFHPYLYVVPSELSSFKDLLLALGVKLNFGASDYFHVLERLQNDLNGSPLSSDQLSFVNCVLEAVADCYIDVPLAEVSNCPLLIPDSLAVLRNSRDLVYNDAPWMEDRISVGREFVHPSISNELATRLGVQSLRCMSLVDEEMTKDLPCMDYARIDELLTHYMSTDFLLFDLLELADSCGTMKIHIIFDNRHHPQQSLLQHNLGDFQGPSLVAIFEDANLSREEISSLQLLPPWRLRGETINYGLGLLSCYVLCDLLSILSGGYYHIFDPRGLVLSSSSSRSPAAKVFCLSGTNLVERFHDQFSPMFVGQDTRYDLSNSTVVRIPLSSEHVKEGPQAGLNKIKQLYGSFMEHGSRVLLFLKSVLQVSLSTWEEGNAQASLDYSICVDSSSAIMRNPFSDKKWKKSQISRLFSSISAATKIQGADQQKEMHVIAIDRCQGHKKLTDKWLMVLSLGSGKTRNMALDRHYLAYSLTPAAGVAALISEQGHPTDSFSRGSIMSPLPLSANIDMPVTLLGCFLVRHNNGRYLFKIQDGIEAQPDAGNQLIEAWNKELMSCVRDSYIELSLHIMKKRKQHGRSLDGHNASHVVDLALKTLNENTYSLWPRSQRKPASDQLTGSTLISSQLPKADWECIVERVIKPFYARLSELPVWQLYSGDLVRVEEGMFLSQPGSSIGDTLLPTTVCNFVKEHYPVFSVPWDMISEIQSVGVRVREIKPRMVRELLKVSSTSIVVRAVEEYVDVLDYCLSDIQLPDLSDSTEAGDFVQTGSSASLSSIQGLHGISTHGPANSGGDALVMMTSFGRALIDFGRGVVEDIGRNGGPSNVQRNDISGGSIRIGNQVMSIIADLKGLPCPTAINDLAKLGSSDIWVGNKEQQMLLTPLLGRFIHLKVLDRSVLAGILLNTTLQPLLKIRSYSLNFLLDNIRLLFHESWVNHVVNSNTSPWFSWEKNSVAGGEGGPSPEWIRLFWRNFDGTADDLSLFADWPLIPAFLGRPILCRVRERQLVFIPPILPTSSDGDEFDAGASEEEIMGYSVDLASLPETVKPYLLAFRSAQIRYPWLISLLNQCNIPIYDPSFLESAAACKCLPTSDQSLGQVIASNLVAAKHAGYFPELTSLLASDCDELFNLFVTDFSLNSTSYGRDELDVLGALPIYKTIVGSYTRINGQDLCMVSFRSFLKPSHEQCLSYVPDSDQGVLLKALGVQELNGHQILVRFSLPGFDHKTESERFDILLYTYRYWHVLEADSAVVQALKETKFVRNADEFSMELFKPQDLFDPSDTLLISVFSGERKRFPGDQFGSAGWLRIIRKLGLRTSAEPDIILECAKRVEFLGSEFVKQSSNIDNFDADSVGSSDEVSIEIWTLGESILQAIFSNFAVLYSNNFCNALGQIACVPTERGFPYMGGKRGKKRVLSSYSEAILLKDWPLAWSSASIISKTNSIPPEYSWGALHLKSPPSFSTVLNHLQVVGKDGGGDTLAHWPAATNVMSVEEASCEVLKYLEKVWDSLSSSDINKLKNVAFLPAANGTRLVRANSLFVHLGVNLSPFAFELPSPYLPFVRILKDLGLREHISVSSAKELLLHLQNLCGYQRLNPNEFRAVTEILHFICNGTDDANNSDRLVWESEAVVPDDGCRLVHARSCVYLDSYGSRFVKYIDCSRLRFAHSDIPEKICLALGIKKLSDVVVEELDDKEHIQTMDRIGHVSLALIKRKLSSRSFQDAICRVVSSLGNYIGRLESVSSELIRSLLVDVADKLQFVQCIYTRFLLLPRSMDITYITKEAAIPEWSDGSRHRALYYINHTVTCILVSEPLSYIPLSDLLAFAVSDVLGSPTPLPIGSLFLCPEGSECLVIDTLKLVSGKEASKTTVSSNEFVGKEIVAQDALQVQLHPLRPFYLDEIVAWRTKAGEKLKYGRVPEDVRPSAGQALYRLKVETAPAVTESLLSSQVFSFKSVSVDNEASPTSVPEDSYVGIENEVQLLPESSRRGQETAQQAQTSNDLQHGRVSPAELVQAVQEMLSAANINVDAEKQALLHDTIKLQDDLDDYRAALLLEQGKAESASKEAETAKAAWQCRICLAAEVDVTLVPCGHVLCRKCSSAVSRCPFCRYQVSYTF
ncbi:hypothetical protein V2J09_005913 [Rumex salicifolius]